MDRIRNLNTYQKCILLLLIALLIVFTAAYIIVSSQKGYSYMGAILQPHNEYGNTVYSGRIHGESASITVGQDKSVTFSHGDRTYGPYTAHEDPSAIPEEKEFADLLTGLEIRNGDEIFFRGSALVNVVGDHPNLMLYLEDGSVYFPVTVSASNGVIYDGDGAVIDPMEPTAYTILELMSGPELTRKGAWPMWILGVFMSAFAVITILFADELFRLGLVFYIRDVAQIELTDWAITARHLSWTGMAIVTLIIYIWGLQI